VEGRRRLLETQRINLASLRGTVQTVEAAVAADRRVWQEEGSLEHQVQDLWAGFAQRDRDSRYLHDRCADLEDEWIHYLYSHMAALGTRAPLSVAAAHAAPAVPALTPDDLAQVMVKVLRPILSSLDSQSQPPPRGDRA
jgi:hypothetical protein